MNRTIQQHMITVPGEHGLFSIEYLTAGQGTPVLLLHGAADSAQSWQWIMPHLASEHSLYALSLPGFGGSDQSARRDYSPRRLTDFVLSFLDYLGLERVSVIGHSLGGLIAAHLSLQHPIRVVAMALISSAGLGYEVSPMVRKLIVPGAGEFLSFWCKTPLGAWQWSVGLSQLLFFKTESIPWAWYCQLYRLALIPRYMEAIVLALRTNNTLWSQWESVIVLDRLHQLTMPVLVLWGDRDQIFPVRQGQSAVERLTCGQLIVLPNCGHMAQVEQSRQVVLALEVFLAATEDRPSKINRASSCY
ncbi:Alpha/beta hydrolase fold protein [Candidatus Methylobacter favarea]|uniref:Alpha/beta hydrolase fold protein n=1 Tax=Candidatus Methylobacter favarea TaxID=2707345 RepID=A0A8S0WKL7_9GAMM|nr:alpha/beta fold hydrolase [Candidatus Methylobacter favarea]CAA9892060.1 Alpha/beta hydrolase fold protein [Candidatus Methylobacter favarea]